MTSSTASTNHRTAAAFEQYVSARRSIVEGTVFFLEAGAHLDEVRRICTGSDIIFAPGADIGSDGHEVGYTGSFQDAGDEMLLDGRHAFELQDYLAAPFISIVGLTVVRQNSAAGLDAFLQDADTARASGVFVEQLLSGAVLLDSRASFSGRDTGAELVRVHVTGAGEYRDGPDGALLGVIGDLREELDAAAAASAGPGRAFERIVARSEFDDAVASRPWLGRYIAALDLLRQWDGAHAQPAISGFGGHLVGALDDRRRAAAATSPEAPFLVTGFDGDFVLVEPRTRRRFRLGADAARGAECLIATGDEALAAEMLAEDAGSSPASAGAAVSEIRARFADAGVDLLSFSGAVA